MLWFYKSHTLVYKRRFLFAKTFLKTVFYFMASAQQKNGELRIRYEQWTKPQTANEKQEIWFAVQVPIQKTGWSVSGQAVPYLRSVFCFAQQGDTANMCDPESSRGGLPRSSTHKPSVATGDAISTNAGHQKKLLYGSAYFRKFFTIIATYTELLLMYCGSMRFICFTTSSSRDSFARAIRDSTDWIVF